MAALGALFTPKALQKTTQKVSISVFLNATDADARAIDGNSGADGADAKALAAAAYRHPISKKFAVVLYVEPVFEEMCKPSHNRRRAHSASQRQSCVRTGDSYVRRTPASIGVRQ